MAGMANYQVQAPDGSMHIIQGPADATPDEVVAQAQSLVPAPPSGFIGELQSAYANRDAQIQHQADLYTSGQQGMPATVAENALSNASKLTDTVGLGISKIPVVGPALGVAANAVGNAVDAVPLPASSGYDNIGAFLHSGSPTATGVNAVGQALNLYGLAASPDAVNGVAGKARGAVNTMSDSNVTPKDIGSQLANNMNLDATLNGKTPVTPNAFPTVAARAKAGEIDTVTPVTPATADDINNIKNNSYAAARSGGEQFDATQYAQPAEDILNEATPKPAVTGGNLGEHQAKLANALSDLKGMFQGQPIGMDGIDQVDKELGQKITASYEDGEPTANTAVLQKVKQQMRQIISPDNLPGSAPANLFNGRVAAAAQFGLNDLAEAERVAALKGNTSTNLQTGYRKVANEWQDTGKPQAVMDAINAAATPTTMEKITGSAPVHLGALAAGHVGGLLGFGAVEGGKIAGDLVKTRAVMGRGAAVKQAIIDDAMSRMKPVPKAPTPLQITGPGATLTADSLGNISNTPNPANQLVNTQSRPIVGAPSEPAVPSVAQQLLLPAPGKASALPMSDTGISIAQRLMNNPHVRSVQGEGVIEQPKGVPASPINIAERLRSTAAPQTNLYRGVSGEFPLRDTSFWTSSPEDARGYAEGAALTNNGENPQVLQAILNSKNGRDIDAEIADAFEHDDDPEQVAHDIMKKENLDYVQFTHPGTTAGGGVDQTVMLVKKSALKNVAKYKGENK